MTGLIAKLKTCYLLLVMMEIIHVRSLKKWIIMAIKLDPIDKNL